jgi:IclR family transcriptional regulator, KDG regulon repressor
MKENPGSKKYFKNAGGVQSLNRALDIVETFAIIGPDVGLTKMAEYLGLNKATAYRLLSTLESRGFLERSPNSRKYRLGVKLFELGSFYQNQINVRHIALPFLSSLMEETQETAFLCIREGDEALCVELIEAKQEVKVFALRIGGRQLLHIGAAPRVLIAQLDRNEIEAYANRTGLPKFTPNSISTTEDLIADVEQTRKNGYAISLEDVTSGIAAIGAPIHDYSGKIIASISISGLISNFDEKRIKDLVNSVTRAAKDVSRHLGYTW